MKPVHALKSLTHLERLESESIHIMREVVAEADNPVMLYSIGKDSSVMLHLAMKAFYPSKPPFPLMHVDTTWKFREMYRVSRRRPRRGLGLDLIVHQNPEALAMNINPFAHGSALHTDIWKTQGLKQALDKYEFDAAFGGGGATRRSRARRNASFRSAARSIAGTRRVNARNCGSSTTRARTKASRCGFSRSPIGPNATCGNTSHRSRSRSCRCTWQRSDRWFDARGQLIMVDDDRMPLEPGEAPMLLKVRFRTLGCYPLTAAVESDADTLEAVIEETLNATTSERQGRVIDHDSAGSMEKKKQEGYF